MPEQFHLSRLQIINWGVFDGYHDIGFTEGGALIAGASIIPFFKSILIFVTSVLALFSASDLGAQALAFVKDLLTLVTAGLPIVLAIIWRPRDY